MRKLLPLALTAIAFFVLSKNSLAQNNIPSSNQKDTVITSYLNNFKEMHVSYYGSTQKCEAYDVYAFKYRKHWFLIVNSGDNLSYMEINPPIKDKSIDYPSNYFARGVAKCYLIGYTKLKKKKRNLIDMDIYGYYKFNRYGRKVFKGLLYLEYPFYNKGILKWKIDEEKAKKLAEKKFDKELKSLESIKTNLNDNIPIEKK